MLFLCTPPYVLALGVLLLFAPLFGLVPLPFFFEVHSYAPPLENPWDFVRSMILPWLCVGTPLAAAMLRLTLSGTIEAMGEKWVAPRGPRAYGTTGWCAGTRRRRRTRPSPRCSRLPRRSW